jgi:rare lipoprotein A
MTKKNSFSAIFLLFGIAVYFGQPILETGTASYYHNKFQGKKTYSGEVYDKDKFTGAHSTLPMGTMVKVTNLKNDSIVILKINDRLPSKKRIIDVSRAGADQLNFVRAGLATVTLEVLQEE